MMRKGIVAAAAVWLSLAASAAQAAQTVAPVKGCLSRVEAQAFITVLVPPAVRSAVKTCAVQLGASAYLPSQGEALATRYDAASVTAWPVAMKAVSKLVGTQLPDPEMAKAIFQTAVAPLMASAIKPELCPQIDRALADLDPLPTQNFTDLALTVLPPILKKEAHLDLPICPATAG